MATPLYSNSRFYILCGSVLLSIIMASYARITFATDQLFYIRLEQIYGFSSLALWYCVLLITPLATIFGKKRMQHTIYARRALGVSTAYFALLHGIIALWGQLGGLQQMLQLPTLFKISISLGFVALVFLLVMAATSFDRIIAIMTPARWKLLHRTGYIGGIAVLLHVWTIGTHIDYIAVTVTGFILLTILGGLEAWRMATNVIARYAEFNTADYRYTLFASVWVLWVVALLLLPVAIPNYHQEKHTLRAAQVRLA